MTSAPSNSAVQVIPPSLPLIQSAPPSNNITSHDMIPTSSTSTSTTTIMTNTMNTLHSSDTRSIFPPFPRDRAIDPCSFSVSFVSLSSLDHVLKRGKSLHLAVFNRILHQHARDKHEEKKTTTTTTTTTTATTTSHKQTSTIATFINQHIHDITRIKLTASRSTPNMYIFYVACTDASAHDALSHAINTHTTLTCATVYEHVIVGKVFPVSHTCSTDILLSHFRAYDGSISVSCSIASYPSSYYREFAFFSASYSEMKQLPLIPPLPGTHTPLTWQTFKRPKTTVCSLCYTTGHTRSKCVHLLANKRFCANCGDSTHVTRACTQPKKCRCCQAPGRIVLDCQDYKPRWDEIKPALDASSFPPLRCPDSSSSSVRSPSASSSVDFPVSPSPYSPSRSSNKRVRHSASFDSESISSYESREDRMVSPALQQHLDTQSLTRRAQTPSPALSRTSSRASSTSSTRSVREQELEQQVQQQHQQIQALTKQIATMQETMQQLIARLSPATSTTTATTPSTTATTIASNATIMNDGD